MWTDSLPRTQALRAEYARSDVLDTLETPPEEWLRGPAAAIAQAMESGPIGAVARACAAFLEAAARFYGVRPPLVRVLAARPLRVREGWTSELFGDYDPRTAVIRVWMRTAVRKQVTSYGTFLSTLCHEFCHHLDYQYFHFRDSHHTRGFYERSAVLYHSACGTPRKRLFWVALPGGRWRIDWQRTKRGG